MLNWNLQRQVAYVQQPHTCYHQIERDRLFLQTKHLEKELWQAQVENKELRVQASMRCKKRRRKPRTVDSKHFKSSPLPPPPPLPKDYVPLSEDEQKNELLDIFGKLNNLSDIIALQEKDHLPCLLKNAKFAKLYSIAPIAKNLNDLVGLELVKAEAFEMISYYTQLKVTQTSTNGLLHIALKGPPGVGKTTTARLFGKLVLGLGVLKNNNFVEARRSDLIGEFLGQTAPKTQKVIDSALGGVLFIDEGNSLGHSEKRDSFSKEAIDTLNQNLTEHKGEFLCIIAGYGEELETCFFGVNRGLKRRFRSMEIKDYTSEQLHVIFQQKVTSDKWTLQDAEKSLAFFKKKHKYFHYFGGDAETLFNKSKFVAAGRMMRTTMDFCENPQLLHSDITKAYEQCFADRETQIPTLSMYT
jgi:hypothetical protein